MGLLGYNGFMNLFQHLGHIFAALGLVTTSFLGQHHTITSSHSAQPVVTEQNVSSASSYSVNKSVTYGGYTVNMSLSVPKNGGNITGNISGDCSGPITGQYDGQNDGVISGQTNITCSLLFVKLPGSGTFTGTLDKDTKTATVQMTLNIDKLHKTEPVTLSFN